MTQKQISDWTSNEFFMAWDLWIYHKSFNYPIFYELSLCFNNYSKFQTCLLHKDCSCFAHDQPNKTHLSAYRPTYFKVNFRCRAYNKYLVVYWHHIQFFRGVRGYCCGTTRALPGHACDWSKDSIARSRAARAVRLISSSWEQVHPLTRARDTRTT